MRPWVITVAIWAMVTTGEIALLLWDNTHICSSCDDDADDREPPHDVWHEGQEPR